MLHGIINSAGNGPSHVDVTAAQTLLIFSSLKQAAGTGGLGTTKMLCSREDIPSGHLSRACRVFDIHSFIIHYSIIHSTLSIYLFTYSFIYLVPTRFKALCWGIKDYSD